MRASQANPTSEFKHTALILAGVSALAVAIYLVVSYSFFRVGFPLDDAWIHQTYARNLALSGRWEYLPGQASSGGSTSPLWTILLSAGYLFGINPLVWAFTLGTGFLWASACLAEGISRQVVDTYRPRLPWIGILFVCEWHLVWAAVSGMETGLFIFLIMAFFWLLFSRPQASFAPGLLIGLSMWVRPDGISLGLALFLALILQRGSVLARLARLLKAGLGFSMLAGPYLLFNLLVSGAILPNTFYAKQIEYAGLLSTPFTQRFMQLALQPLVGVGLILLPLILFWLYLAIRKSEWPAVAVIVWAISFILLYALRLPVAYQHGRYEMPVIPVVLLSGGLGGASWLGGGPSRGKSWLIKTAWLFSAAGVCLAFLGIGAQTYASDVTIIESEMVDTAHWVANNIPAGQLVAAHDIGALGYYGAHPLLDMAGLISPDVIPLINDPTRLAAFLDSRKVQYLVTLSNWYPGLTAGKVPIHKSPATGDPDRLEFMGVYQWK